jgi:hypothetical protein
MPIRLRPHHLLCLLTYVGKGYHPTFTANFDDIAKRLSKGAKILIVSGPDDICAPLLTPHRTTLVTPLRNSSPPEDSEPAHCFDKSVADRDRRAAKEISALLATAVQVNHAFSLDARRLAQMRAAFATSRLRRACEGCPWQDFCTTIASDGYRHVRIIQQ